MFCGVHYILYIRFNVYTSFCHLLCPVCNMMKKSFFKTSYRILCAALAAAIVLPFSPKAYALTGEFQCGLEEHSHSDACYTPVLICELDEAPEYHVHNDNCYEQRETLVCADEGHEHDESCYESQSVLICTIPEYNIEGGHRHIDSCYEKQLHCTVPEHSHSRSCYYVSMDNVETAEDWEATLPDTLSGNWRDDFISVARSQLGYTPLAENSIPAEDGSTMLPYTRYGDWYGFPYGEWCVMFVSFCANYADIPRDAVPYESGCVAMVEKFRQAGVFEYGRSYVPRRGDLVFVSYDGGLSPSHVGIVTDAAVSSGSSGAFSFVDIEGNSAGTVRERPRSTADADIFGYMNMEKVIDNWNGIRRAVIDCGGTSLCLKYPAEEAADFDTLRATSVSKGSKEYAQLEKELPAHISDVAECSFYRIDAELSGTPVSISRPDTVSFAYSADFYDHSAGIIEHGGALYAYVCQTGA